jgi:hypothetical protein
MDEMNSRPEWLASATAGWVPCFRKDDLDTGWGALN